MNLLPRPATPSSHDFLLVLNELESMPAMKIMVVLFLAHSCFLTSYPPIVLRLVCSFELIGNIFSLEVCSFYAL